MRPPRRVIAALVIACVGVLVPAVVFLAGCGSGTYAGLSMDDAALLAEREYAAYWLASDGRAFSLAYFFNSQQDADKYALPIDGVKVLSTVGRGDEMHYGNFASGGRTVSLATLTFVKSRIYSRQEAWEVQVAHTDGWTYPLCFFVWGDKEYVYHVLGSKDEIGNCMEP
jgi:hypothetical protein